MRRDGRRNLHDAGRLADRRLPEFIRLCLRQHRILWRASAERERVCGGEEDTQGVSLWRDHHQLRRAAQRRRVRGERERSLRLRRRECHGQFVRHQRRARRCRQPHRCGGCVARACGCLHGSNRRTPRHSRRQGRLRARRRRILRLRCRSGRERDAVHRRRRAGLWPCGQGGWRNGNGSPRLERADVRGWRICG